MAHIRFVVTCSLLAAVVPTAVLSYEVNTHQGLTQVTVQAYEKLHGDVFSADVEQRMISGSAFEDNTPRPLNHFYDPINYRGLTVGFSWQPSEEWAQDTEGQGNYCNLDAIGARNLCGARIGYNDKLFSSPTDFSWNRAIYEYVYGDKSRALETLGHVLHLLQDATVPAHVRNDQHLNHNEFGDSDPYERFTSQFGLGQISAPGSSAVPSYSNLNSYFDHTANFTNKHFVSKDSVFKNYSSPDFKNLQQKGNFVFDPTLGSRVAYTTVITDFHKYATSADYSVDDPNHLITSDNWSILSKEAIRNGVGVVDLFFKNVEEEKKTGALKKMNVSAAEKHAKDLALDGFKYAKALYGSSLNQSDVEELLNEGQAGAAALAIEAPVQSEEDIASIPAEIPVVEENLRNKPTLQKTVPASQPKATSSPPKSAPNPAPRPRLNPVAPGFGGGGSAPVPDTQASESSQQAASADLTLGVTSPAEGAFSATTSVAFSGTTTPLALISASFATTTATTTADGAGDWSITIILSEGSTTVSFIASDDSGSTSATTTRIVTVDLTSPAAPSAAINECDFSLATSTCLVASATATISWSAVADGSYYGLFKNSVLAATTTATSTTASITDNATTTFAVVAYDAAGNAATSTSQEVFTTSQPLILNEVAWMGTTASSDDEWIEIKNRTPYTLDLSRVAIVSADDTRYIPLSGTVAPLISSAQPDSVPPVSSSEMLDGFYTIERRSEAVNFTMNGTSTPFGLLSDSGEELKLVVGNGTGTTTVDTTPAVAACGGWCAGSTNFQLGSTLGNGTTTAIVTMERVENAADGSLASSWRNNDYYWRTSSDAGGNQIYGTPGWKNSLGLSAAGWFCSPDKTPLIPNASYTPHSSDCTYLSRFIFSDNGRRDGGVYRGTPGNATAVSTGHLFGGGTAAHIAEDASSILASPGSDPSATGQQFFTAIWETRAGPAFQPPNDDSTNFDLYLRTGVNLAGDAAAPHDNYRVIPWVYGL